VTVILAPDEVISSEELRKNFMGTYPGIQVIIHSKKLRGETDDNVKLVNAASSVQAWSEGIKAAQTPYLLIGLDLRSLNNYTNLERSIRLLQDPSIGVISGATRNASGHWRSPCLQAEIANYHLKLRPGYEESPCDCMKCDIAPGGPLLLKSQLLKEVPFQMEEDLSVEAALLSWFLDVRYKSGKTVLSCPDVLYSVHKGIQSEVPHFDRSTWKFIAKRHRFQGVTEDSAPRMATSFKCEEVGLNCSPRQQQEDGLLLPWCCLANYAQMLDLLEQLSLRHRFHYELDAGSLLGGVKIGHFIPWDIDGDIYVPTEANALFRPGGVAYESLKEAGISVYSHSVDSYGEKGVGYFMLWKGGVEVEMLGRRGNLSFNPGCQPDGFDEPTRVSIGHVWTRTHANPGQYARSRYGRGYLKHAQSWRYNAMDDSWQQYESGKWRSCSDPADHACLERHPGDGNVIFHPEVFEGWMVELKGE